MTNLKAIIFDVDGTLSDTENVHRIAFNKAFAECGVDWHWSEALYLKLLAVTGGKERIVHYIEDYHPLYPKENTPMDFARRVHAKKTEFYAQMVHEKHIHLRPGIQELIEQARQKGVRLAIATTTTYANVEALLASTLGAQSLDWFDIIAAGEDAKQKKPAPDIYHYVLEKMGWNVNQCVAVEDSENGIQAALAANLKTVIITNPYTRHQNFTGAALVVDRVGDEHEAFNVISGESHGYTQLCVGLFEKIVGDK